MKRVIIESPYGTKVDGSRCTVEEMAKNHHYGLLCALDCLRRNEAPFGSHLLYTLVLNDATQEERKLGMEAGFAWGKVGETCAAYVDYGITSGMRDGILKHTANGLWVEYRALPVELMLKMQEYRVELKATLEQPSGLPSYHDLLGRLCETFSIPGCPTFDQALETLQQRIDELSNNV